MRTGVTISGIIVLILGLAVSGIGAAYGSLGGEVAGAMLAAIGIITGGVGAVVKAAGTHS